VILRTRGKAFALDASRTYAAAFLLLFRFPDACDKALAAADFAAVLAFGLRITFAAALATFLEVTRLGDFLCDNALAADRFAFLLAAVRRNTLPARLAALCPVPLIGIMVLPFRYSANSHH
jgi:hypothetical protein